MIARPTTLQLLAGLINAKLKALSKREVYPFPKKVGNYKLVSQFSKERHLDKYFLGLYQCQDEKVVIKTWQGAKKDSDYYELVNEYNATNFLREKFSLLPETKYGIINTPRIKGYIEADNSFSVIYEYLEGDSLSKYPPEYQANILQAIIGVLSRITRDLAVEEKEHFFLRTPVFYLFSLPLFTILAVITNVTRIRTILRAFAARLSTYPSVRNLPLQLNHRDLNPNNVLIGEKMIYLLDCGRLALTIPGYDLRYLRADTTFSSLSEHLPVTSNKKQEIFLQNYIALHVASYKFPSGEENPYLGWLLSSYG